MERKGALFQELRILFTFLGDRERKEYEVLCRDHGGIVLTTSTPNDPPHVVVTRRVGSPKYCSVLKKHPMTPVVSPEWIKNSIEVNKRIPYGQYSVGPCYGLRVCLSGFLAEEKEKLAGLIQKHGGAHSPSLNKHCTHLISTSRTSEKYLFAQKQGIVCVNVQWLVEGIKSGWCRDAAAYPVKDSLPVESKDCKTSSLDRTQSSAGRRLDNGLERNSTRKSNGTENFVLEDSSTVHTSDKSLGPVGKGISACDDCSDMEDNFFLDHCVIWAVGCSVEETMTILKLCRKSGAKRLAFGHPSLVTHILRGSSPNPMEIREVVKYLEDRRGFAPPVVNLEWLQRSVARRELMPVDERFSAKIAEIRDGDALLQRLDSGKGVLAITNEHSNISAGSSRKLSSDGIFSGYYFTLSAVRGTSEESVAEVLVRQNGGKIFNSSLPTSSLSMAFAICPPSLTSIESNRLKAQSSNFASVLESNRFTVYWLRCCSEAKKILTPQKGTPCFKPLPFKLPMDGASGISIAISGYDKAVRSAIKHTVETIGGRVSLDCMSAKDTHLLVPAAHGEKYKHSERLGVHAVTADWLVDSVASGRLLPESGYRPAPLAGRMPEALVTGPPSGVVDASQHPWAKPTSQASKGSVEDNIGHAMTDGGKLNKTNALKSQPKAGPKGKKRKFVMPSLQGTSLSILGDRAKPEMPQAVPVDKAPADLVETDQVAAHSPRNIDSGRLSSELDTTQNHSSKDESLAQAMQHVSSLLAKVRHGQASSNQIESHENRPSIASTGQAGPSGVMRSMKERRSKYQERRMAPARPQSSHHEGDIFEVSQRRIRRSGIPSSRSRQFSARVD